jgi:homoserine O-acetyltransferase
VESLCGHDAFLLPNDLNAYGRLVEGFLDNLNGTSDSGAAGLEHLGSDNNLTSIFHDPQRLDYHSLAELIPAESSVLDLGCGMGGLLTLLRRRGHGRIMGVELDEHAVVACVRRGLDVIQADLNRGLSAFGNGQFDVVVLSQTLQTVIDVPKVINEMLRVGRRAIVSFPNQGYHKRRRQLFEEGRAPVVTVGGGLHWYDTPDVRFLTITDFDEFCREQNIRVHQRVFLNTETGTLVEADPNLNADLAIAVLSK